MSDVVNDRYEDSCNMSLSARDQYEREISWIETEPLEPSEEKKYLDRLLRARLNPSNGWLKTLAKDARERLTEHYQPLVRGLVLGCSRPFRGVDFLDLVQEANISLLRAFDTFPSDFERPFKAWVVGCIRVGLRKFYWEENSFVRLGYDIQENILDIAKVLQRYSLELGRSPDASELAFELGLSLSRIYELLHYRHLQSIGSVEVICEQYEVPEDHHSFQEMYQQFSEDEIARSDVLAARVEQAVAQLSRRRCEVARLHYGLCGEAPHTNQEICALLNIVDSTTKSTLSAAKKQLQVMLAPLYEEKQVVV